MHQNRIFLGMIYVVFFGAVGSLLSGMGRNDAAAGVVSFFSREATLYIGSYIYLAFHILLPLLFVVYTKSVLNIESVGVMDSMLLYFPIAIAFTVVALNPLSQRLFRYDNGVYHRGDLMAVFYMVAVWYAVMGFLYIIRYRNNIQSSVFVSFLSFIVLTFIGVVLQYFDPDFKIESFFNAIVLLMCYVTIERPGDYVDSATGLQNDYAFFVSSSIRIKRGRGVRYVILSLDNVDFLDNSIGSEVTSELLTQLAVFLDGMSKDTVAYRLNRDLFALALKDGAKSTHFEIMEAIRSRLSMPFVTDKYSIMLFECMMYVNCPDDVRDTEELEQIVKLFSDKEKHKMRHEIKASAIDLGDDRRRNSINLMLHTAIADERFSFKYQPVKNVHTGVFDSVEMKPMLESPEYGMVAPGEYFSIAEGNGTAVDIVKHIIDIGFEYMEESGLLGTYVQEFCIPVSNAFLLMRSTAEWVLSKAVEYGIEPANVVFEISEKTLINYNNALEENIRALSQAGFSFMLMDYGNGYTDAEVMIKMHLKEVCLNRDLLMSAPLSAKADTLVQCAVEMMRGLSIGIKAAGIDSPELEKYAVRVGVDKLQGFELAKFQSGAELMKFMKERKGSGDIGLLL